MPNRKRIQFIMHFRFSLYLIFAFEVLVIVSQYRNINERWNMLHSEIRSMITQLSQIHFTGIHSNPLNINDINKSRLYYCKEYRIGINSKGNEHRRKHAQLACDFLTNSLLFLHNLSNSNIRIINRLLIKIKNLNTNTIEKKKIIIPPLYQKWLDLPDVMKNAVLKSIQLYKHETKNILNNQLNDIIRGIFEHNRVWYGNENRFPLLLYKTCMYFYKKYTTPKIFNHENPPIYYKDISIFLIKIDEFLHGNRILKTVIPSYRKIENYIA